MHGGFHVFRQKHRLPLIGLVIVGCLAACGVIGAASAGTPPDFGPATYPMARSEFLARINARLVASCDASREEYNLDRDKCLQLIARRTASCAGSVPIADTVADKARFKMYGRAYLACAKPHFFCDGVEVKTLEAAMDVCG